MVRICSLRVALAQGNAAGSEFEHGLRMYGRVMLLRSTVIPSKPYPSSLPSAAVASASSSSFPSLLSYSASLLSSTSSSISSLSSLPSFLVGALYLDLKLRPGVPNEYIAACDDGVIKRSVRFGDVPSPSCYSILTLAPRPCSSCLPSSSSSFLSSSLSTSFASTGGALNRKRHVAACSTAAALTSDIMLRMTRCYLLMMTFDL